MCAILLDICANGVVRSLVALCLYYLVYLAYLAPRRHLYLHNALKMLFNFHWFALLSAFKFQPFEWSLLIFSFEWFTTNNLINKTEIFKCGPTNTDAYICADKFMESPLFVAVEFESIITLHLNRVLCPYIALFEFFTLLIFCTLTRCTRVGFALFVHVCACVRPCVFLHNCKFIPTDETIILFYL